MLAAKYQMPRFVKGRAYPKWLKGEGASLSAAEQLVSLLPSLVGESRLVVEQALSQRVQLNPKVAEGLVQLLMQLSLFSEGDAQRAAADRALVFDHAAAYWKAPQALDCPEAHRDAIAAGLPQMPKGWTEDPIPFLFADLPSQQKLLTPPKLTAQELIDRYNLAQAQGLLLRAKAVELELLGQRQVKRLLQMLKFFGLLFEVKEQTETKLLITIEGPTSVLEGARSYGVELANFFPAVVSLTGSWSLKAEVQAPGKPGRFLFECSDQRGYRSHYRPDWNPQGDRLAEVVERFNQKYGPQCSAQLTQQLFTLGNNQVLLPDLKLVAGKTQGWVQWLGYLSPAKQAWLVELKPQLPPNYRFVYKGKPMKYQSLVERMEPHLVLYASKLTAPGLKKILENL